MALVRLESGATNSPVGIPTCWRDKRPKGARELVLPLAWAVLIEEIVVVLLTGA